jgi:hypothetical protein
MTAQLVGLDDGPVGESAIVSEPLPAGATTLPAARSRYRRRAFHRPLDSSSRWCSSRRAVRATESITVRVRVKDTRGFVVRDALVFVRSTPRVTSGGDRQATTLDGWVTYPLLPNGNFPKPRKGYHVQFFVKTYRSGDPALAGIAAYRLVQVPLAG